jgi:predicted permease
VSTEVALAFVLLAGAGLLLRSFTELRTVKTGIDTRNVVTMDMSLDAKRFEKTAGVAQLARDVQQRVESIPGVVAAASTWTIPVENAFSSSFVIEGRPLGNSKVHGMNLMRPVSPHFFQVFRIPLLRGRYFTERDNGASQGVALVSETLARKFWPHGNPIGERISVDKYHPEFAAPPREIVGVVADVRDLSIDTDPMPMIYFPQAQVADGMTAIDTTIIPITWVIRTKGDPASLTPAIQRELRQASGGFPIARVRTMREVLGRSTSLSDFNTLLMGVFAGIALFLAAIGIYGLISYTVQQKTREIGIRMALGATEGRVRSGLLWYGMRLVLLGLAAGSVAAFGLTRFLASLLYGSKTMDPIVFAAVGILLGLIALLAAYIPARRATRVDPMVALRCE